METTINWNVLVMEKENENSDNLSITVTATKNIFEQEESLILHFKAEWLYKNDYDFTEVYTELESRKHFVMDKESGVKFIQKSILILSKTSDLLNTPTESWDKIREYIESMFDLYKIK